MVENEKKKDQKLTFWNGDLNLWFFEYNSAHNLNFEGDGIKSR